MFSTVTVGVTGNKKALVSYNLFSYKLALALVTALTYHRGWVVPLIKKKFNRKGGRGPGPAA
jgi:hypothetical protein